MKQVLVAAPISEALLHALIHVGYEVKTLENIGEEKTNIHGILTSNKLVLHRNELEKYSNLKWIGRLGSGMEIVDTDYCDKNNIRYFNSPNGIANSVAEHIMGMLLSLLHHIESSFHEVQSGLWIREANRGIELEGQTLGIIGFGHTGQALANKLRVFTNHIIAYDKYKSGFGNEFVKEVSLAELQANSDIISFHVPLTAETLHYYDEDFMHKMHKPHILINASRGAVIETPLILKGLQQHKIKGACLDVVEEEKQINWVLQQEPNILSELCKYPVLITPHIAGYSHNAIQKMSEELRLQLDGIW
ncbi:MAG: hydroxyacid dehydrogenase [Bacteroidetes bacterium]|nr:hydroxyacid dehydrogenase [Bacteroidota bacterium]